MTVDRETVVVTGLGATTPLGGDAASTWAATAISTIDSESMSRSSTKLLLGVTSSAGTPAISSTISPSPARISWSFMAVLLLV